MKLPRPIYYFLVICVAIILAAIINAAFGEDAGYVKMVWGGRVVQTSFIGLLLMLTVLYFTIRGLAHLIRSPSKLKHAVKAQNKKRAQQRLTQGMIDVSEGNFAKAEKALTKSVNRSDTPLLNYLNAARAAQAQGKSERRDQWLKKAYEKTPEAAKAILLTQAELQLESDELEQSLATLQTLEEISPGHRQSLRLQAKLYERLADWQKLRELMPKLQKFKAYSKQELDAIAVRANAALLDKADTAETLALAWKDLDKVSKQSPELISSYALGLLETQQTSEAEKIVTTALKKHWHDDLLDAYAQLDTVDVKKRLSQVETWLKKRGESAKLLQVAAQLSMQDELWGKARSYLESSLTLEPSAQSYSIYGDLLATTGDAHAAAEAYKKGLSELLANSKTKSNANAKRLDFHNPEQEVKALGMS